MSPRDWREWADDIIEAYENARSHIEGVTYEEFARDVKTLHAAAFELVAIGEAAGNIPTEVRERHQDIPWQKMRSLRNVVAHEYFRIDPRIVWRTITENLPPVITLLRQLRERNG